jgi:hypothetical protein
MKALALIPVLALAGCGGDGSVPILGDGDDIFDLQCSIASQASVADGDELPNGPSVEAFLGSLELERRILLASVVTPPVPDLDGTLVRVERGPGAARLISPDSDDCQPVVTVPLRVTVESMQSEISIAGTTTAVYVPSEEFERAIRAQIIVPDSQAGSPQSFRLTALRGTA